MSKNITETKNHSPKPKVTVNDNGTYRLIKEGSTKDEILALFKACGTNDVSMMQTLVDQLVKVMPPCFFGSEVGVNGALTMLSGIAPKNELEGMLAVQMVSSHFLIMETAKRAMIKEQSVDMVTENINRTNKLMRTFTLQTEALSKLRGNSKTVTVKHVTVTEGGQAIIGDVHHGNTDGKK